MLSSAPEMLQVSLALPSGHNASLSIPQSSKVVDLKALAQQAFQKPSLRLVTAQGRILTNPAETLEAAGLQDGDQLTVIVGQAQLAANAYAFALRGAGGDRVVTWGNSRCGGNSFAVRDQLRSVQQIMQIQATLCAFAAILEDGSVPSRHGAIGAMVGTVLQSKIS